VRVGALKEKKPGKAEYEVDKKGTKEEEEYTVK
jgi:hypothetical protein